MASRCTSFVLLALLLLLPLGRAPAAAAGIGELRAAALELANADRRAEGLPLLRLDPLLSAAAQRHAEDMLARGYFAHESPEGGTVMDRFLAAGGSRSLAVGENLASCARCAPADRAMLERFEQGWMRSPGHRENLLGPGFDRFGFGLATGRDGRVYAVQTFAGPGQPHRSAGGAATPLGPDAQRAAALDRINALRRRQGLRPLTPSAALAAAARSLLARHAGERLAGVGGLASSALFEAIPADDRRNWRSVAVLAGECGGCGVRPTDADIAYFIDRWAESAKHHEPLLDPAVSHLGFALAADGDGRKVALAVLGTRR